MTRKTTLRDARFGRISEGVVARAISRTVSWYHDNMESRTTSRVAEAGAVPSRTQTGLRMDRTLLKVLKGLAEYLDMSLADLVEGMLLHGLEGSSAISDPDTFDAVDQLRVVYGLRLTAADSHRHPEVVRPSTTKGST